MSDNHDTKIVADFYDANAAGEWQRIANRPEFLLTCRLLKRHLKPGDSVLDIGGGPGRYALHLAQQGLEVTLFDLSPGNIQFASDKALELGLQLPMVVGDARMADKLVHGQFDHVLLMGPLYHLLDEADRIQAVEAAIKLLKPGGTLWVAFLNLIAGIIYAMKHQPDYLAQTAPAELAYMENFVANRSWSGDAFTRAIFAPWQDVLPFMARFSLDKLHLFGQEGIMSPCEERLMTQPPEIIELWLDLCEQICEREDLLNWSEHLVYVGRKRS